MATKNVAYGKQGRVVDVAYVAGAPHACMSRGAPVLHARCARRREERRAVAGGRTGRRGSIGRHGMSDREERRAGQPPPVGGRGPGHHDWRVATACGTERSTTARACMATRKKALLAAHRVATAAHRNHRLPDGAVLILVLVAAAA